jgi:hypothetical protein
VREPPTPGSDRASEGALFVTEELVVDQGVGEVGAGEGHEGTGGPRAKLVDGARQ